MTWSRGISTGTSIHCLRSDLMSLWGTILRRLIFFTQNQEGIYISELYLLNIGEINDMYVEMQRDEESHEMLACQDDFDRF